MPKTSLVLRPASLAACLVSSAAACWPAALAAPGEWPMWRRDRRLTGFQPMPGRIRKPREAWSYFLGEWEAFVVVRPGRGPSRLRLAGTQPKTPSFWDDHRHAWGLGDMRFDLAGDGRLIAVGPRHNRKVGKLMPDVKGLQMAEIVQGRRALGEETDQTAPPQLEPFAVRGIARQVV